eukprot:768791-Pyramimonas_sp.AAC.1
MPQTTTGIRTRRPASRSKRETTPYHSIIHFPWQPAACTNKSAGCNIILGERVKCSSVTSIE